MTLAEAYRIVMQHMDEWTSEFEYGDDDLQVVREAWKLVKEELNGRDWTGNCPMCGAEGLAVMS